MSGGYESGDDGRYRVLEGGRAEQDSLLKAEAIGQWDSTEVARVDGACKAAQHPLLKSGGKSDTSRVFAVSARLLNTPTANAVRKSDIAMYRIPRECGKSSRIHPKLRDCAVGAKSP